MKLLKGVNVFRDDEDGAVTVDWVVLTAAIVGLGIAVLTLVAPGTQTATKAISTHLDGTTVTTSF